MNNIFPANKTHPSMSFLRDHIPFGFGTAISLNAKTHSVPQFIGPPKCNSETIDLDIESSTQLALGGQVSPSDTLFLAIEIIHYLRPPHTEESPRCSKFILRSIF